MYEPAKIRQVPIHNNRMLCSCKSIRKLIKILVCLGCIIGFVYQTSQFALIYLEYPIVLDLQVTNPATVSLPAITLCNNNYFRRNVFCSRNPEYCEKREDLRYQCNEIPHYCEHDLMFPIVTAFENMTKFSTKDFVEMAPQADSLFPSNCTFMNYNGAIACSERITFKGSRDILLYPHNCFRVEFLKENETKVSRTTTLIFGLKFEQEEYALPKIPVSYSAALHEPYSFVAPFHDGFLIKPGKMYEIFLQMEEKHLLPHPFATNCTDYIGEWRSRGNKGPTTQWMCIEECKRNVSLNYCKCISRNVVLFDKDDVICPEVDLKCLNETTSQICIKGCQQACYSRSYSMEIQINEAFKNPTESQYFDRKATSYAIIVWKLMNAEVTVYSYRAQYQSVEILSYVGGYVGIWLGISLVTLFNLLETFALELPSMVWKKENKKFTSVKSFKKKPQKKFVRVI